MNSTGEANRSLSSLSSFLLEFVYPSKCALCGSLSDISLCAQCESEMQSIDPLSLPGLDSVEVLYHYSGRAGQAVRRLKYSRATALASPLALKVKASFQQNFAGSVDAVIPVPIHWSRRFLRGFNQSELLVSELPDVRKDLLKRVRATSPQASLSREARRYSLDGAFLASPDVNGMSILLVDDVTTSGTTGAECAKALRAAGAAKVFLLAFAGTPN